MSFFDLIEGVRRASNRILVVGLGVSGVESARLLIRHGFSVVVVERQDPSLLARSSVSDDQVSSALDEMRTAGVNIHFGLDGERVAPVLDGVGLAVLSPGVSLESSIVGSIVRRGIPVISHLECTLGLHGGRSVVVAGSNGKSTTAALIKHLLRSAGVPCCLLSASGSDGSFSEESVKIVEASSYQLEASTVLKPSISVLLNVNESGLERHGSLERYAQALGRVCKLQDDGDLAVVNADDKLTREVALSSRARLSFFGESAEEQLKRLSSSWAHIAYQGSTSGVLRVAISGRLEDYDTSLSALLGSHNRYNIAAAVIAARHLGVSQGSIQGALESFKPLEHRLEICYRDEKRLVINDSKSTSVAATQAALETVRRQFPGRKVAIMIGGLSKAGSWGSLLAECRDDASNLFPIVCFGRDAKLLANHCRAAGVECVIAATLQAALDQALEVTNEGGIVLLSPGCSSFDEFSDFEDRGRRFKGWVEAILNPCQGAGRG